MAHPKQQVREAVGVVLSASPVNWSEVVESRLSPARDIKPYLMVYCVGEDIEPITVHSPVQYQRSIEVVVQGRKRLTNDVEAFEDALDVMAQEIEQKLTFSALQAQLSGVKSLILISTDSDVIEDEYSDRIYAAIQLNYVVSVSNLEGVPETLL